MGNIYSSEIDESEVEDIDISKAVDIVFIGFLRQSFEAVKNLSHLLPFNLLDEISVEENKRQDLW